MGSVPSLRLKGGAQRWPAYREKIVCSLTSCDSSRQWKTICSPCSTIGSEPCPPASSRHSPNVRGRRRTFCASLKAQTLPLSRTPTPLLNPPQHRSNVLLEKAWPLCSCPVHWRALISKSREDPVPSAKWNSSGLPHRHQCAVERGPRRLGPVPRGRKFPMTRARPLPSGHWRRGPVCDPTEGTASGSAPEEASRNLRRRRLSLNHSLISPSPHHPTRAGDPLANDCHRTQTPGPSPWPPPRDPLLYPRDAGLHRTSPRRERRRHRTTPHGNASQPL